MRFVWGSEDQLLALAGRGRPLPRDWLPQADWVELDGVGHCPQLDVRPRPPS